MTAHLITTAYRFITTYLASVLAGLDPKLAEFSLQFIQLRSLPISSSICDGVCHLAKSLPAASLSEYLTISPAILPSSFLTLACT